MNMVDENSKAPEYLPLEFIADRVLSKYDLSFSNIEMIKFKNTEKQRAVYKITTDQGPKCLKKVFYDKASLLFIYSVTEWLNLNGIGCPRFLTTSNGHKYMNHNNNLFILTDWIEGRKCDYDNLNDVYKMSENLSLIHNSTKRFNAIEGSRKNLPNSSYFYSYCLHFYHLLEFWNKSLFFKDDFSKKYIELFDQNMNLARKSLEMINSIDFNNQFGSKYSISHCSICHLDYVNKNIVFDQNEKIYTIDFDNSRFDFPVHDLCYFLRRIMKREETAWDFKLFLELMSQYEKNRILSKAEYLVILAILMFPQKFWKLSKDYFRNRKYCNSSQFIQAMDKTSEQQGAHELFVMELSDYIDFRYGK